MSPTLETLSSAAVLARMSLTEHPGLNTPEAIAYDPYGIEQLDVAAYEEGLRELQAHGLAEVRFGNRWFLIEQPGE